MFTVTILEIDFQPDAYVVIVYRALSKGFSSSTVETSRGKKNAKQTTQNYDSCWK